MVSTNVFIIHTEYHLMLSVHFAVSLYSGYNNHIYITDGHRVRDDIHSPVSNVELHNIPATGYGTSSFLKKIQKYKPENFFFFQEGSSDNMYLAFWLHRAGTRIGLLQDGLKPYVVWNRYHLWVHRVLDTIRIQKEVLKRKTFLPYFRLLNQYSYGEWSFVDDIWLSFPKEFKNRNGKILKQIPDFTKEALSAVNQMFNVEKYNIKSNDIVIVGQPRRQEYWEREIEVYRGIVEKFPNRDILFKAHPNMKAVFLEKISQIEGIKIIDFSIPVELLILQLKYSYIISGYSTALLTNNPSCHFYWFYKFFGITGRVFSQLQIVNPSSHIKEISSIDEIV